MYYTIKRTHTERDGERLEYHIGRERDQMGMSKALNLQHCTAEQVADRVAEWHQEAILFSMKAV